MNIIFLFVILIVEIYAQADPVESAPAVIFTVQAPAGTEEVKFHSDAFNWESDDQVNAVSIGDNTWTATIDPGNTTNVEYKWIIDGVEEDLSTAYRNGECSGLHVQGHWDTWFNRQWVFGNGNVLHDIAGACRESDANQAVDADQPSRIQISEKYNEAGGCQSTEFSICGANTRYDSSSKLCEIFEACNCTDNVKTPYPGCTVAACTNDATTPYAGCNTACTNDTKTPYPGCTVAACIGVDTPYPGCTVAACIGVSWSPYPGCTVAACTNDANTPYDGCTVAACIGVETPYPGCNTACTDDTKTPYDGCTVAACIGVETPYPGCTVAACTDDVNTPYDGCIPTCSVPFISEVAVGYYVELFNPTDGVINMSGYALAAVTNSPVVIGEHEYWDDFTDGATIAPGDVYVVCRENFVSSECNQTMSYRVFSNGDDGLCLAQGTNDDAEYIDCVGDFNKDPGSGWAVAGVNDATKDHTLVRKASVKCGESNWTVSAGTSTDDSEWIVNDRDDWTNVGKHVTNYGVNNNSFVHQV